MQITTLHVLYSFIKVILHAALQAIIITLYENNNYCEGKFLYWRIKVEIGKNKKTIRRSRIDIWKFENSFSNWKKISRQQFQPLVHKIMLLISDLLIIENFFWIRKLWLGWLGSVFSWNTTRDMHHPRSIDYFFQTII